MGEFTFNRSAFIEQLKDQLEERMEEFAGEVAREARQRAPIRKDPSDRRRRSQAMFEALESPLITGSRTYSAHKFGKVTVSAREFERAMLGLGIPVISVAAEARRRGRKLAVQVRRHRRSAPAVENAKVLRRRPSQRNFNLGGYYKQADRMAEYEDRPGRLKRSIIHNNTSEGNKVRFTIRAEAPYARYVEFPTSRTAAQPFLLPALKNARGKMVQRLKG